MKLFNINGVSYNFPETWGEVTLEQLLKINAGATSTLEIISIFTGLPIEELSKSKDFKTFEEIFLHLHYLSTPIEFKFSDKPSKFVFNQEEMLLPSDLGEQTIAQYEDMKLVCQQFFTEEGEAVDVVKRLSLYVRAVSIYLQPVLDKIEYDFKRAEALESEIYKCSAVEVADWGNFFIRKFTELRAGILKDVQALTTLQKKRKRDSRNFLSSLVSSLRSLIFQEETSKSKTIS